MDELKAAAFEYLLLNPGSEFGDWQQGMIEQYPTEVVDALGSNPEEVFADLADLWGSDYTDPKTGMEQKLSEWAMSFANEYSVGVLLLSCRRLHKIKEHEKTSDVRLLSANRQVTIDKEFITRAQAAVEE